MAEPLEYVSAIDPTRDFICWPFGSTTAGSSRNEVGWSAGHGLRGARIDPVRAQLHAAACQLQRIQCAHFTPSRLSLPFCARCSQSLSARVYAGLLAEILFLRRQIAMFAERGGRPRRARRLDRVWLILLSKAFDWRTSLAIIQPATFLRWHREAFRHFWRWKSRVVGRPPVPEQTRELIRRMGIENPTWGCRRIADELNLKVGLVLSPRTVRKYLPKRGRPGNGGRDQRWSTFVRNHASTIVASDFVVSRTALFRTIYTFVVMEIASRRILLINSTAHPTAAWTTQQLREVFTPERSWQYLLHDRDSIFSEELDSSVHALGIAVLKSPPRSPKANAFCERLIGTLRRECLDWIIPMGESHLRSITREWAAHYNRSRPHSALRSVPEPGEGVPAAKQAHRHRLPAATQVVSTAVLGGLHHEYALKNAA